MKSTVFLMSENIFRLCPPINRFIPSMCCLLLILLKTILLLSF